MANVAELRPKRAKTGGRKPGSLNKATLRRRQLLAEATIAAALKPEQLDDLNPLMVMRAIMRNRYAAGDYDGALAAAQAAAPYVHARLNSTDVTMRHSVADKSDGDIDAEIRALQRKLAAAQQSPLLEASTDPVTPLEPIRIPTESTQSET